MVGAAFGINVTDVAKAELLITLEAFLLDQTSQGKRCLLVVDEAQNLTPRAVEELRMLSNFQFGNQALLQSFLVGQPEFQRILQRPEMEQLRQRVAATCHIGPLDLEDTQHYIEHRLKCAGAVNGKPFFDLDAFAAIYKASKGIPRRINSLCDRLLLRRLPGGQHRSSMSPTCDDVVAELAERRHDGPSPRGATTDVAGRSWICRACSSMPAPPTLRSHATRRSGRLAARRPPAAPGTQPCCGWSASISRRWRR